MVHDRRPFAASADPRPASAVSTGAGMAGLAGVALWLGTARLFRLDGPYAALVMLAACALPMVVWSLAVDKVHRRPSTGIDWNQAREWSATREDSLIRLAGYWITWAGIALFYFAGRFYWQGDYPFAMWCLGHAAPVVALLSIPYVFWLDRYLIEPRDGAWHLGAWLTGQAGWEAGMIQHHLRAWAVKGFFLAFMLAIVPPGFGSFVRADTSAMLHDPVALSGWLVTLMFTVDVAFATVGYVLTFRPLDAHIRTANPFAAAWMAALICYPPFVLMATGGPLDYHPGTSDWVYWVGDHPVLLALWGAVLVALTAIYAWSTVAFGPRFSNLTHRGIITHGPYAWSRHPAYLSKNLFWWVSTIPVLSTGSLVDAARATLLMGAVSGVYYWRARTEERHLGQDPTYADYSVWMSRHAPVPRLFRWVGGRDRTSDGPLRAEA
ncbi:methyltransferase family protein [Sphingomonas aerophila]|uniref:Protein-S-isoprenylcysteine O-methyltransferase Ste14 n=1 Tax=Sphingomonas aerophila TaxID=1344948 RepID=A0A7W9EVH1_9SPHN|nr:isoprenylcysteine carboxylmethyltransferase family protein [Sphingomonas aerophila]MBB5714503.1 protein-S-isoprenylcysteine O-methyltransferase Ste14 [Sphingomonas aerophila]